MEEVRLQVSEAMSSVRIGHHLVVLELDLNPVRLLSQSRSGQSDLLGETESGRR